MLTKLGISTTSLPCLAIGGVRVEDAPGLRAAGAAGLAVVSGICAAPDPAAAAARYLRAFAAVPAGEVAP